MVFDQIKVSSEESTPMVPRCPFCEKDIDRLIERRIGAAGRICYICPHCKKILGITKK